MNDWGARLTERAGRKVLSGLDTVDRAEGRDRYIRRAVREMLDILYKVVEVGRDAGNRYAGCTVQVGRDVMCVT